MTPEVTTGEILNEQADKVREDLRTELHDLIAHLDRDPVVLLREQLMAVLHNLEGRRFDHLADSVDQLGPWFRSRLARLDQVAYLLMDKSESPAPPTPGEAA